MALIKDNFDRLEKNRNSPHQEVDCTYSIFTDRRGNKYLQLDTYGSKYRKFQGKTSQSIQFDQESAKKLFDIIRSEFEL